jgi:hypothetical protein
MNSRVIKTLFLDNFCPGIASGRRWRDRQLSFILIPQEYFARSCRASFRQLSAALADPAMVNFRPWWQPFANEIWTIIRGQPARPQDGIKAHRHRHRLVVVGWVFRKLDQTSVRLRWQGFMPSRDGVAFDRLTRPMCSMATGPRANGGSHAAGVALISTRIGVGSKPLQGLLTWGQFEITNSTSISAVTST